MTRNTALFPMTVLFISDLHLSPSHPEITDCFYRFLNDEAPLASALYILGDLFEVWVGDDDDVPLHHEVAAALKVLSDKGVAIYFIHGNRDFMIGKRFAKASGMTLLPEHTVIDLFGKPTLILHGDTLCIQDEGYQRYRKKCITLLPNGYSCAFLCLTAKTLAVRSAKAVLKAINRKLKTSWMLIRGKSHV